VTRIRLPRFRKIGHRILALVALGFAVTAIGFAQFNAEREARTLRELGARDTERLLQSVIRSLESIMLPGQAALAQSFAGRLKDVPDVLEFRILRADGSEAFLDNATLNAVNTRLGAATFAPRAGESKALVLPRDDEHLRRVMDPATRGLVSYETRAADGARVVNYLYAIPAQAACAGCHGAERPHLGAFKLSVSMAAIDGQIAATHRDVWLGTAGALGVLLLVAGLLIHTSVVRPIRAVTQAMERASRGDLRQAVPVPGEDEVGQMADSFNVMLMRLDELYAGLRRERDKLTTVIDSTGDGVVVTSGAGNIVFVNEAAMRLLGKRRERIVEDGFLRLLDEPKIMGELLARQSEPPVPYRIGYKARTLRVTAATIRSRDGQSIGSAALLRDITPADTEAALASDRPLRAAAARHIP
jgi:PAS domain S-box-containing protein